MDFEERIAPITGGGLFSSGIETLQVNLGLRCNQSCSHCHVAANASRTEMMDWSVMEQVLLLARQAQCRTADLTGGAPELNPNFRRFVSVLRAADIEVQVRTNLTALLLPETVGTMEFLWGHGVQLVGSLPCYLEENVRGQRGVGVYEKSIEAIRGLNLLGYGSENGPTLNLVYNPAGPLLPPEQTSLEKDYRRELSEHFGIVFTHLLTISNMPIGRFRSRLAERREEGQYLQLLKDAFNPATLNGLMCRHQLSVGWNGTLYDCDFNLALGCPVNHGASNDIRRLDLDSLVNRRIVTGDHCYGCTAGLGSSCAGALAESV